MAKARREIEEKLKVVDIALVLLDSRIPYSSQNPMAMEILKNKPQLVVLTKSDMADSNMTKKWENYFNSQGKKSIAVDSITPNTTPNIDITLLDGGFSGAIFMSNSNTKAKSASSMTSGSQNTKSCSS